MRFAKYTALGNDYLIVPADNGVELPSPARIRQLCDRHYGVGSDGMLFGPLPVSDADFRLRLFNPDGGEFEKSGNGLRIFSRYLWDCRLVGDEPFTISTPGGIVRCRVHPGGRRVSVEMGRVSFSSADIPVAGPMREVIDEPLVVAGKTFRICAATIGNPHCVVLYEAISPESALRWGPLIENHPAFPNRTNVQFMSVIDRKTIAIEIWERGAGYTLASGSSSCAAAASARRLGLCDPSVTVKVQGGELKVNIFDDYSVTLEGGVARICDGIVFEED